MKTYQSKFFIAHSFQEKQILLCLGHWAKSIKNKPGLILYRVPSFILLGDQLRTIYNFKRFVYLIRSFHSFWCTCSDRDMTPVTSFRGSGGVLYLGLPKRGGGYRNFKMWLDKRRMQTMEFEYEASCQLGNLDGRSRLLSYSPPPKKKWAKIKFLLQFSLRQQPLSTSKLFHQDKFYYLFKWFFFIFLMLAFQSSTSFSGHLSPSNDPSHHGWIF